jgi:hypothetical protein
LKWNQAAGGTCCRSIHGEGSEIRKETGMRAIILWILGVPISVIILLYVFHIL